jgi:hypothetical protein
MQFILFIIILLLIALFNNIYENFNPTLLSNEEANVIEINNSKAPLSNDIYNSNSYGLNLDMKLSNEKTDIISNAHPYKADICPIEKKIKKECCLITDEFIEKKGELYDSTFEYIYKKLSDGDCNDKKYNTNKSQLYIDGVNDWDNNMCKPGSVGSCRFASNECIDLQRKKDCDKAYLEWSPLPCEINTKLVFDDRLKKDNKLPKMPDYGTVKFFG